MAGRFLRIFSWYHSVIFWSLNLASADLPAGWLFSLSLWCHPGECWFINLAPCDVFIGRFFWCTSGELMRGGRWRIWTLVQAGWSSYLHTQGWRRYGTFPANTRSEHSTGKVGDRTRRAVEIAMDRYSPQTRIHRRGWWIVSSATKEALLSGTTVSESDSWADSEKL